MGCAVSYTNNDDTGKYRIWPSAFVPNCHINFDIVIVNGVVFGIRPTILNG